MDVTPIEAALPVPLFVRLETSGHLIRPGETLQLILSAWRATEEKMEGLSLFLDLPEELKAVRGNIETEWKLTELENTEIFSRTIDVRVVGGAFPFETAVVEATLRTAATEAFAENRQTVKIGIESRADEPPASPVAKAQLREKGLVLRGRYGDVTLLVEAESAEAETEFTYTDGYRWGETVIPENVTKQSVVTATAAITTADLISVSQNRLYLPRIDGGSEQMVPLSATTGQASTATDPNSADEDPIIEDGVAFVRRWTLDANYRGEKRATFDKRIQMIVDASWLISKGFDVGTIAQSVPARSSGVEIRTPILPRDQLCGCCSIMNRAQIMDFIN